MSEILLILAAVTFFDLNISVAKWSFAEWVLICIDLVNIFRWIIQKTYRVRKAARGFKIQREISCDLLLKTGEYISLTCKNAVKWSYRRVKMQIFKVYAVLLQKVKFSSTPETTYLGHLGHIIFIV